MIEDGIITVLPATQDQFVPQMANFELVGGVSFQKGCYPGQEIVARLHFKGGNKRWLHRIALNAHALPAPGDWLPAEIEHAARVVSVASAGIGRARALVVSGDDAPGGGFDDTARGIVVTHIERVHAAH